MDKLNMNDLNEWIEFKKPEVERRLVRERNSERTVRTRSRDQDEQKILDMLCIERWKKAERDGKVKYITKRKWYYDFD